MKAAEKGPGPRVGRAHQNLGGRPVLGEEAARQLCGGTTVRAFYRDWALHDVLQGRHVRKQLEMLEHHADARAIGGKLAAGEHLSAAAEADLLLADANGP